MLSIHIMKVTTVVLFFMVLQVNASYFDAFRGAMSSVENAFGKLLNDVVTDVKSTVHCTILAMERVLAMNGIVPEPLPNDECYKDSNNNKHDVEPQNGNHNFYSVNDIASQINSTISRVNETLSNILDNHHERLQGIRREIQNESNRLAEVSYLLKQELEKISHRMKNELQSIDHNSDKVSIESLWNDMKLLYEVEKNDENVTEVKEIGQVFNEALNVLHINKSSDNKSDKDKIQAIVLELEHESNNSNVNVINKINHELSELKEEKILLQKEKRGPEETLKSFKDVATKIFKEKAKMSKEVDNSTDTSSRNVNNKFLNENLQNTNDKIDGHDTNSDDNSPFNVINTENNAEAIDQAMDIIKNGAQTQKLIDDLFAQNVHAADVFDNPDLFDFNK